MHVFWTLWLWVLERFSEERLMGCGAFLLAAGFFPISYASLWVQGLSSCLIGFGVAIGSCPVIQLCEKLLSSDLNSSIANGGIYIFDLFFLCFAMS